MSDGTLGSADAVWDLVGDTITEVTWIEEPKLGADPWFHLASGGRLELFSDAAFDTWVMQLSGLVLVGPLLEETDNAHDGGAPLA